MSTLAVGVALKRSLLPAWRGRYGAVAIVWAPAAVLTHRIKNGERADVLIMIDAPMNQFVSSGIIAGASVRPIARAGFGLGVRAGAPRHDVSTPERFRAALLAARAVAFSETGASGHHVRHVIEELGIAAEIKSRAVIIPEGFTGEKRVSGAADLAVQQISEPLAIDGVEVAGPFPGELQAETDFSAGVFADAADQEGARAFLAHLTSPEADTAFRDGRLASRLDCAAAA